MKHFLSLPLLVVPLWLSACEDSESKAAEASKKFTDAAKQVAGEARQALERIRELDVSKLVEQTPEQLQELGRDATAAIAAQLDQVKDAASAERANDLIEPLLDKLIALKSAVRGHLPDASKVHDAMTRLASRLSAEVMATLQPLITRLQSLAS